MSTPSGPLTGIKVVEFGQNLAGPYAAEILGMLGAQTPDGNFEFYFGLTLPISKLLLSQICTIYYFAHFLLITPIVSTMEKPLPVPESIATAVLAKTGAGSPAKANG